MGDLISRQKVLQCIKESREDIDWGQSEDGDAFLHYSAALYRTIACEDCFPSAQPEIIYCKDCRYSDWYECLDGIRRCYCMSHGSSGHIDSDYCSYAERRQGE